MHWNVVYIFNLIFIFILNGITEESKNIRVNIIYGQWEVIEHTDLLNINREDQDTSFITELKSYELQCKSAVVIFKKNKIYILPQNACGFLSCDSLKLSKRIILPKLTDPSLYYRYPGAEIINHKMVSQSFLDLIGSKENQLTYIDTNCLCDNGDYTLKIILLNKNKIVLFTGVDITVLART